MENKILSRVLLNISPKSEIINIEIDLWRKFLSKKKTSRNYQWLGGRPIGLPQSLFCDSKENFIISKNHLQKDVLNGAYIKNSYRYP